MITSGYSALAGFIAILELLASVVAFGVGIGNLLKRPADEGDASDRLESRTYLAALLAYLLLGLSLASWVTLYLMLDSFVPQWPGAMCIFGVTRIGEGSRGIYSWLPTLVVLAQWLKPALVFTIGASLVLYRFYRHQATRGLLPRVAALLLATAVVALLDSTVELAYVAIPKYEDLPNSGCCSVSAGSNDRQIPIGPDRQHQLVMAYYLCQFVIVSMIVRRLVVASRLAATGWSIRAQSATLLAAAAITLWVSMRFLVDVASPALLHLPYHHCLYDLVATVPETGLAIGLLLWGTFCLGWTSVLAWFGREPGLAAELRVWPAFALVGYLGSMVMISLELGLA